jgi:hypothetical protein
MGRVYSVLMDAISVTSAQDLVRISAPSDAIVVVHEVLVTNEDVTTSDQGAIQIQRASTDGTGSAYTAKLLEGSDAAFGGSAVVNLTAATTAGDILWRAGGDVRAGWHYLPTPEARIVVPPSGRVVVRSDVAITAATLTCVVIIEEIG